MTVAVKTAGARRAGVVIESMEEPRAIELRRAGPRPMRLAAAALGGGTQRGMDGRPHGIGERPAGRSGDGAHVP